MASTVDWCEPNHIHTSWIAETYNTLSSLALVAVGCHALYIAQNDKCLKQAVLSSILILVGVGSVLFHATLKYWAQMLDELSMFWFVLLVGIFLNDNERRLFKGLALIGGIAYTIILVGLQEHANLQLKMFQWVFVGMTCRLLWNVRELVMSCPKSTRQLAWGTSLLIIASACWLIDVHGCDYLGHIYLHAAWHLLSATSLYFFNSIQRNVCMASNRGAVCTDHWKRSRGVNCKCSGWSRV